MSEIVAVVTDLFFQSRIIAAARAQDLEVRFITANVATAELKPGGLALVDLDVRLDALEAIRRLKQWPGCVVVAFGPHLDAERLKAARAAGADRVLAKSKFVTDLPELVASARASSPGARQDKRDRLNTSDAQ